MSAKTCQVDGTIYVAFRGQCEECAGFKDDLCDKLDICHGGVYPWRICPTRNQETKESLRAERDKYKRELDELRSNLSGLIERCEK